MKVHWTDVAAKDRSDKHRLRQLDCGTFYLTLHEYLPGWQDEWHSHPESQFGWVLQGEMQIWTGDDAIVQPAGQAVFISGGVRHKSAAPKEQTITLNMYVKPNPSSNT